MRPVMLTGALLLISVLATPRCHAQRWVDLMLDGETPLPQVKAAFDSAWAGRAYERSKGWKQFNRWYWYMDQRTWPSGERPSQAVFAQAMAEVAHMRHQAPDGARSEANWSPLGPLAWNTTSYNPGNGRVNAVAMDPTDPDVLYVGTPSAGLWKSIDGGGTWQSLFTDLPSMGVSSIVVDPDDPSVVYMATGDGDGADTYSMGVLKSTDGGATWNTTGLSWTLDEARTTRCLRMAPTDPQRMLCAASGGLFFSADGGGTWDQVRTGNFSDVEFQPGNDSIVYASALTFNRSTNGGATFAVPPANGLPSGGNIGRMAIAVSPNQPQWVYVLCSNDVDNGFLGLYRSTDGGLTFTLQSGTPNLFGYETDGSDTGGQAWYDMALAVDPENASIVYAGGVNVWKSTDAGQTWDIKAHWIFPSDIGYTHADIHTLEFLDGHLFCGSDGGLYRSADGAEDWTDLSAGLNITQFYRLGGSELIPYKFMAGAQDNGTNRLVNGNWTHVFGADGMEAAIDPEEPQIVYGTYQMGGLLRSYNNGQDWDYIGENVWEDGPWITPFLIDPDNTMHLLAGYMNIWSTWDRGDSWEQLTNWNQDQGVRCLAMAPSNSNVIYAARQDIMERSLNGGLSWTNILNGLPQLTPTSFAVDPEDPMHVYVSFSGNVAGEKVYASTNGGLSWANHSMNLPNVAVNSVVYEPGTANGLYAGTDMGVFYTNNTFSDWQPFGQGLPNVVVSELEVNLAAGKLRAATYGRGLWESDLFTTTVGITDTNGSAPPRLVPLDQEGRFALVPGSAMPYTGARVLDALGRTVWHYQWGLAPPPVVDLHANAPGLYLVELTDGRRSWALRVVR